MIHRSAVVFLSLFALTGCEKPAKTDVVTADASTTTTTTASLAAVAVKSAEAAPVVPAPPPIVKPMPIPLRKFAGFSRDGRSFAYIIPSGSAAAADMSWRVSRVSVGEVFAAEEPVSTKEVPAAVRKLTAQGFSPERRPAPNLTLETHLTVQPPIIMVRRLDSTAATEVYLGDRVPFGPEYVAEIWGLSPDGKYVAVHVAERERTAEPVAPSDSISMHYVLVAPVP